MGGEHQNNRCPQDVSDPELNIRGPYARLRRQVDMYQVRLQSFAQHSSL